jgi:hypothetical protein
MIGKLLKVVNLSAINDTIISTSTTSVKLKADIIL